MPRSQKSTSKKHRSDLPVILSGLSRLANDLQAYARSPSIGTVEGIPGPQIIQAASASSTPPLQTGLCFPTREKQPQRTQTDYETLPATKKHRLTSEDANPRGYLAPSPFQISQHDFGITESDPQPPKTLLYPQKTFLVDLPNELLYQIQDYVDGVKDLKAATLVCRLFQNIFLPAYLAKCGFHPRGAIVSIKDSQGFVAFQSYYRCTKLPSRMPLMVTFSRDVNADIEALRLASGLACLPGGTFRSISLWFSRYKPISPWPLAKLLAILPQTQCLSLMIASCFVAEQLLHFSVLPCPSATWGLTTLALDGDLSHPHFKTVLSRVSQSLERLELMPLTNLRPPNQSWERLLDNIHFPRLSALHVHEDISLHFLLSFLARHPRIFAFRIAGTSLKVPSDPVERFDLHSLSAISGPPSYALAILRSALNPVSLTRLTLQTHHLPNSSIFHEVLQCLARCLTLETLEISMPSGGMSFLVGDDLVLPEITFLNIKTFRIILDDVCSDVEDREIIIALKLWQKCIYTVERIEVEDASYLTDRKPLYHALCEDFPALGVSVYYGSDLLENKHAIECGGFGWHTI